MIRALNADVPYDRFVTEHLAGDLLENPRRHPVDKTNESILGTGFWFLGEAKHSPVDARGDQADRIDNQIDVFGKTFLGMTLACARCHDHKFDAISTKDYYALAGFLQSSRQERAFIDDPAPRLEKIREVRALNKKAGKLAIAESVAFLKFQEELSPAPLGALLGDKIGAKQFQAARKGALQHLKAQQAKVEAALAGAVVFADARREGFRDWLASGEAFTENPKHATVSLDFSDSTDGSPRATGQPCWAATVLARAWYGHVRSPAFVISKKKIHVRAAGKDVRVNLILDGLQLIRDPIYGGLTFVVNTKPAPRPAPGGRRPAFAAPLFSEYNGSYEWHTMDVSMWIGHRAYIEILDEGPGHAAFDRVVFSDEGPPLEAPNSLYVALLDDPANDTSERLARSYQHLAGTIVNQWGAGTLEEQPDAWEPRRFAQRHHGLVKDG